MHTGTQTLLSRRRFDVDDYHRMGRAGILFEDDRVELLDGEIVETTPIGSRHAACVTGLTHLLVLALSERARVRTQSPLRLDRYSEPEPDLAVVRSRSDHYAGAHPGPGDTLLIVEVADSSLRVDRGVKLHLYARVRIPEVWIVDLSADTVEVYREPRGHSYETCIRLQTGSVAPLVFPELEVEISEIVPASG